MPKDQKNAFFNGPKDADGELIDRCVIAIRGVRVAKEIQAMVQRLEAARSGRK